jgi:uncharacterized protein (TIGR03435 family)
MPLPGTLKNVKALLVLIVAIAASAQAPPVFEAASIHPSRADQASTRLTLSAGRLSAENSTLSFIIQQAYSLRDFQVAGGPQPMLDARFDIQAKAASPVSDDQLRLMAQTLLADRFHLKVHREMRPMSVYALVIAKGGPKLQAPKPGEPRQIESYPGFISGTNVPISAFIEEYSGKVDLPVIDKTGFTDRFDFTLRWTPDGAAHADPSFGSIFTEIQTQLGLKFDSQKIPVEVLVIDHAEQPSAN